MALIKENFIKKNGIEAWNLLLKRRGLKISESRKKRNTNTKEHWIKIYGKEEGEKKWKEKIKKCILSKENFIKRHGKEEGEKKWYEYLEKNKKHLKKINSNKNITKIRSHLTIEYWINKGYTEKQAKEKIFKFQSEMSKRRHLNEKYYKDKNELCIEYWIKGGYSEEEAKNKLNKIKEKYKLTKDNFIKKYGKIKGIKKYNECNTKRRNSINRFIYKNGDKSIKASKASLKIFKPIYEYLISELNFDNNDIYFGYKNKSEYFIANNKYFYSYDFTILSLKLIFEFNGIFWHPKSLKEKFENPYFNKEYKFELDKNKINKAKEKNFDVIILWEDISIKENIKICKEEIKRRIK